MDNDQLKSVVTILAVYGTPESTFEENREKVLNQVRRSACQVQGAGWKYEIRKYVYAEDYLEIYAVTSLAMQEIDPWFLDGPEIVGGETPYTVLDRCVVGREKIND